MFTRRTVALFSALLVGFPLTAMAGEGRTPIPFTSPVAFPIVISTPGSYVLTRNLTGTAGFPVIEIATPGGEGVELDLNGMVLTAGGPGAPVISIVAPSDVSICNGHTRGGSHGVLASGASRRRVTGMSSRTRSWKRWTPDSASASGPGW